jgi:hypothetical protein
MKNITSDAYDVPSEQSTKNGSRQLPWAIVFLTSNGTLLHPILQNRISK